MDEKHSSKFDGNFPSLPHGGIMKEGIEREMSSQTRLAEIGGQAESLFTTMKSFTGNPPLTDGIEHENQRFKLWAHNLGLFHLGHRSLDYRFRDSAPLFDYTLRVLRDLKQTLYHLKNLFDDSGHFVGPENHPPPENCPHTDDHLGVSSDDTESDDDLSSYQSMPMSQVLLSSTVSSIDRLYRLAFKVRNTAIRIGSPRGWKYCPRDPETGVDLIQPFEKIDLGRILDLFGSNGVATHEDRSTGIDHNLASRLARANIRRRRQFAYWKHCNSRNDHQGLTEWSRKDARISQDSSATSLDATGIELADESSTGSTATSLISGREFPEVQFPVPPPPTIDTAAKEFQCPYCFFLLPKETLKSKKWEVHVYRDLRPYICTYPHCYNPDQQYDGLREWMAHEISTHMSHHVSDQGQSGHTGTDARWCVFCKKNDVSSQHIACHLRQIACFALPRSSGESEVELTVPQPGEMDVDMPDYDYDAVRTGDKTSPDEEKLKQTTCHPVTSEDLFDKYSPRGHSYVTGTDSVVSKETSLPRDSNREGSESGFSMMDLSDNPTSPMANLVNNGELLSVGRRNVGRTPFGWPAKQISLTKCETCRERKVTCDQQKPHCGTCQKSNVICKGYHRSKFNLALFHRVSNFKMDPIPESPNDATKTIPRSPDVSIKNRRDYFLRYLRGDGGYLWVSAGIDNLLAGFIGGKNSGGSLQEVCIDALTSAYYAVRSSDSRALEHSRVAYSSAVRGVGRVLSQLRDKPDNLDVDLLMSVVCLCLYQNITRTDSESWKDHFGGITMLLERQGPAYYTTGENRAVLSAFHHIIIVSAIALRRPCFLAEETWKEVIKPDRSKRIVTFDILLYIAVEFPGLLHVLDGLNEGVVFDSQDRGSVAFQTAKLQQQLQKWRESSPLPSVSGYGYSSRHIIHPTSAIAFHNMLLLLIEELCHLLEVPWLPLGSSSPWVPPKPRDSSDVQVVKRNKSKHLLASDIIHLAHQGIGGKTPIFEMFTFIMPLNIARENLMKESPDMNEIGTLMSKIIKTMHCFNIALETE